MGSQIVPNPTRVALFGLPGRFAATVLETLASSGLPPAIVVEGFEGESGPRGLTRLLPAQARPVGASSSKRRSVPGWLERGWSLAMGSVDTEGSALVEMAHRFGIDVVRTDNANRPSVVSRLRRLKLDVLVVAGFHHLLAVPVLHCARLGGFNLHPGKLPDERGPSPLFWTLKAGRTRVHWTVHRLETAEDSGDIVAQGGTDFEPGARGLDLLQSVAEQAGPELTRCIRALARGKLESQPQAPPSSLRAHRPSFRDGRIDVGRPAVQVYTFVAGCAGRYPLFVESAGDRYFIADAVSYQPDGQLAFEYVLTGNRLLLRCQPGLVELEIAEDGALFAADY